MKKNPRTARTDAGRVYEVFQLVAMGEGPCPGAAHDNPHIDNCSTCAPHWGVVTTFAPVDVLAETARGLAVRVIDAPDAFEPPRGVAMVTLTEKGKGCIMNYNAYVSTAVRA